MESDVLSEVVKAEKEIRELIGDEKKRCRDVVAQAEKETEEELAREEERLKTALIAAAAEARKDAEKRADEVRADALRLSRRLTGMNGDRLREILMPHLVKIIPGERHDSQDVEG